MSVFCIGLIGLYGTSAIYHGLKKKPTTLKKWRVADHIMIYILIASTYTPICLVTLQGWVGYVLLSIIWILSLAGIALKVLWLNMPRKIYTLLYLILGWAAIFAIIPIYQSVGLLATLLLVSGGLAYSVGAVIYAKKPTFNILNFGFHEVFHLFILLGSSLHFTMIFIYVL
jgi:hemolysin III